MFVYTEHQICREKVGEQLMEKIMDIADSMNKHEYVPKMPNQSELELVFDTSISDVQPYLYKVRTSELKPNSWTIAAFGFLVYTGSASFDFW